MKKYIARHALELLMVVSLIGSLCVIFMEPATETDYIQHTVQTGETVWAIAERYADKQVRPFNEFVYEIQAQNKLAGRYIQPGDVLVIPIVANSVERTR